MQDPKDPKEKTTEQPANGETKSDETFGIPNFLQRNKQDGQPKAEAPKPEPPAADPPPPPAGSDEAATDEKEVPDMSTTQTDTTVARKAPPKAPTKAPKAKANKSNGKSQTTAKKTATPKAPKAPKIELTKAQIEALKVPAGLDEKERTALTNAINSVLKAKGAHKSVTAVNSVRKVGYNVVSERDPTKVTFSRWPQWVHSILVKRHGVGLDEVLKAAKEAVAAKQTAAQARKRSKNDGAKKAK